MIEATAIEMRERLGLEPWELFAARARVRCRAHIKDYCLHERDLDRQSGRSTRGLLRSLAACRVQGVRSLHVIGTDLDVCRAQDFAARLGLDIRVLTGGADRWLGLLGGVLVHWDHLAVDMERLRR